MGMAYTHRLPVRTLLQGIEARMQVLVGEMVDLRCEEVHNSRILSSVMVPALVGKDDVITMLELVTYDGSLVLALSNTIERGSVCNETQDFDALAYTAVRQYDRSHQVIPESDFDGQTFAGQTFAYGQPFPVEDPPLQDESTLRVVPWQTVNAVLDSFGNEPARR
ncbi:unnamed protein product, partial [Penicillium palitans]